jgi:peroxiredoxin
MLEQAKEHKRYDSIKQAVDSAYALLVDDQRTYIRNFITKNSGSLASLTALYQNFGREPMVNEQEDFDLYEVLEKNLSAKYPGSPYVTELKEREALVHHEKTLALAREQKLDSGNVAPDIALKTPVGTNVSLSSFKGHVVLLHFWAGWSAVSQQDIEYYKFLKKKYESKGLVLFGVSLDKDRQGWEDAVRENKITWTQVSDLMEWRSPIVKAYNVTSIPVCFLIGSNGKIVCKRPDKQQLADRLYKIYKF